MEEGRLPGAITGTAKATSSNTVAKPASNINSKNSCLSSDFFTLFYQVHGPSIIPLLDERNKSTVIFVTTFLKHGDIGQGQPGDSSQLQVTRYVGTGGGALLLTAGGVPKIAGGPTRLTVGGKPDTVGGTTLVTAGGKPDMGLAQRSWERLGNQRNAQRYWQREKNHTPREARRWLQRAGRYTRGE